MNVSTLCRGLTIPFVILAMVTVSVAEISLEGGPVHGHFVQVNGGPTESGAAGAGFGTLNFNYIPVLFSSDQHGNETVVVSQDQQECDSHPTHLDLRFTGKSCSASSNDLGPLFTCDDFVLMQDVSKTYITIESEEGDVYFEGLVAKGEKFRLGDEYRKLPADLVMDIQAAGKNGSLLQKMKFHVSWCNKPISTRDDFGSLTILGLGDGGEKHVVGVATDDKRKNCKNGKKGDKGKGGKKRKEQNLVVGVATDDDKRKNCKNGKKLGDGSKKKAKRKEQRLVVGVATDDKRKNCKSGKGGSKGY